MKILHIASGDLWAGAEVQIKTLLSELVKAHDVYAVVLNEGRLSKELESIGVDVKVFPESNYSFLQLLANTRAVISKIKPDIVHTHRQKENILGSLATLFSGQTKNFRTVHGSSEFSLSWKQRLQKYIDLFAARYLQDGIFSVSDTLTLELSKSIQSRKIKTVLNGIDQIGLRREAYVESGRQNTSVINIGIAGRMVNVKRIDIFLKTAQLLAATSNKPNYHFHVFGDGPLLSQYKELAKKLKISEEVSFYGHCNNTPAHIKNMNVMVMTSDHEGLPMTALESLALEVPLVAHAVGGLKPLLQDSWPEGLVYEHAPEAYRDAVTRTLFAIETGRKPKLGPKYTAETNAKEIVAWYQNSKRR